MRTKSLHWIVGAAVIGAMCAFEAAAWGPDAQRGIAHTSLAMLRRTIPTALKSDQRNYDEEVLRGAMEGYESVKPEIRAGTEEEAIESVAQQIQLLREVRRYGISTYFNYRMGVLSSLVADIVLPYGIPSSAGEEDLRRRISADIDRHITQYVYMPGKESRAYIDTPWSYFRERRMFFGDAKEMIAIDYAQGVDYGGYLRRGGPQLFNQAITAVTDTWYTVLRSEGRGYVTPSDTVVTWYFVNELRYLLEVRSNVQEAEQRYAIFDRVNPGILAAYEQVGDAFYAAGAEERGVMEWQKALRQEGEGRPRVSRKLAEHYLERGRQLLASGIQPGSDDTDLPNAIEALTQVQYYARDHQEAMNLLAEARRAHSEREARRQTAIDLLASAERVMREAQAAAEAEAVTDAINTFKRAQALFEGVDEEFPEQYEAADSGAREAARQATRLTRTLLEDAERRIDEAGRAADARRYQEAIDLYAAAMTMLDGIPAEPDSPIHRDKQQHLQRAQEGSDRAKTDLIRYQQEMEAQAAAGGGPA